VVYLLPQNKEVVAWYFPPLFLLLFLTEYEAQVFLCRRDFPLSLPAIDFPDFFPPFPRRAAMVDGIPRHFPFRGARKFFFGAAYAYFPPSPHPLPLLYLLLTDMNRGRTRSPPFSFRPPRGGGVFFFFFLCDQDFLHIVRILWLTRPSINPPSFLRILRRTRLFQHFHGAFPRLPPPHDGPPSRSPQEGPPPFPGSMITDFFEKW